MMYDYQFVITGFEGSKRYYMERYSKELSSKELQDEMHKISREMDNVKYIQLEKSWTVHEHRNK